MPTAQAGHRKQTTCQDCLLQWLRGYKLSTGVGPPVLCSEPMLVLCHSLVQGCQASTAFHRLGLLPHMHTGTCMLQGLATSHSVINLVFQRFLNHKIQEAQNIYSCIFLFCYFVFCDKVSLGSSRWPWTPCVVQTGLTSCPPASASKVLAIYFHYSKLFHKNPIVHIVK